MARVVDLLLQIIVLGHLAWLTLYVAHGEGFIPFPVH